jgi:hypothetical protein
VAPDLLYLRRSIAFFRLNDSWLGFSVRSLSRDVTASIRECTHETCRLADDRVTNAKSKRYAQLLQSCDDLPILQKAAEIAARLPFVIPACQL